MFQKYHYFNGMNQYQLLPYTNTQPLNTLTDQTDVEPNERKCRFFLCFVCFLTWNQMSKRNSLCCLFDVPGKVSSKSGPSILSVKPIEQNSFVALATSDVKPNEQKSFVPLATWLETHWTKVFYCFAYLTWNPSNKSCFCSIGYLT